MLFAAAERRLGIADKLAALIADPRDPHLVRQSVAEILHVRMLAIACGYEDGNDLDHLRGDPGFKLACGRLPDSSIDLSSQPTVSRRENAQTREEVAAKSYGMIDIYCASQRERLPWPESDSVSDANSRLCTELKSIGKGTERSLTTGAPNVRIRRLH